MGEVLHGSLLQLLLENCDFLNIDILQGSVATRLRCGGIFKYGLVENLPVSLPMKEFWKSVNIWGSYGQEFGVLFFETLCTLSLKNYTDVAHHNFDAHQPIWATFLAEMLLKEYAIKRWFIFPPHLTNVSTLPEETRKHENRAFQMLC